MGVLEPGNRRNLALRVASAVVLLPLALWITWMGGLPFALLAAAAAAVAAAELVMMFGTAGVGEVVAVAVAGALPLSAALGPGPGLFPAYTAPGLALALVLLLAAFLFRRAPIESIPPRAATAALSWLYCGLLVSTAVGLRRIGLAWILLAFVVTWGNDTLAYFAGHALGRHRMMERISPRKTWEGFAGGAVGSVAGALMCRYFLPELRAVTAGGMALLGAGAAVLGPLGDLCESLLKRAAGVKDSGRIIPGHGGLLDRIDALLFVAPWVYLWAAAAAR